MTKRDPNTIPDKFKNLIGKDYEYVTPAKNMLATVLNVRWSLWYISNETNEKELAVELRLKPLDGGINFWSRPFPTGIKKEVTNA